jgi:hypothetical protein
MTVYALRKRDGQWMICSAESATMLFETYEEALEVARKAASIVARAPADRALRTLRPERKSATTRAMPRVP